MMNGPRYDARDILEKYVATLNQPGNGIIRDAAELGHPKDVIRFVLQHCIRTIEDSDKQEFLRNAYISLGNFQELNNEQKKAVMLLGEIGSPASPGTDLHGEQAKRISGVAAPLQVVIDRLKAEAAVLGQELACLPGAHSAAAMPPSTANSAPVT
jgi:hypothetical protein